MASGSMPMGAALACCLPLRLPWHWLLHPSVNKGILHDFTISTGKNLDLFFLSKLLI